MDLYHFRCPSCGLDDSVVGPAKEKEVICGVCYTGAGRKVRLERWKHGGEPAKAAE